MTDRTHRFLAIALMAALAGAGCNSKQDESDRVTLGADSAPGTGLDPVVQAQLDSGNVAFRAGETQKALDHYTQATRIAPEAAAGWYGIVMAQQKLGNQAAADSALAKVKELSPSLPTAHPSGAAPVAPGGLPAGHPTTPATDSTP